MTALHSLTPSTLSENRVMTAPAAPARNDTAEAVGPPEAVGPIRSKRKKLLLAITLEALLIAAMLTTYRWVRFLLDGQVAVADTNALWLWHVERFLHLPNELSMQQWALSWDPVSRWSNIYYVGAHFPGAVLLLAWLFIWKRSEYARARAELVLLTGLGLVVHALFPLTPPRLASNLPFIDTMQSIGPSAYSPGVDDGIANQFAAMPSLHVGWALLVAVVVTRVARSRLRRLVWLHPAITIFVVVVTANHYWLDGLVAGVLLAGVVGCVGSQAWGTVQLAPLSILDANSRLHAGATSIPANPQTSRAAATLGST